MAHYFVMRLLRCGAGPTPFDGQYLVEYDPERDGRAPDGAPMLAHVLTSPEKARARRFRDAADAWRLWGQTSKRRPLRADGKPNRPLTAFTIEITQAAADK